MILRRMTFLPFSAVCAILFPELNREQQVRSAVQPLGGGGSVKREAGVNPARSRHCDKGVHRQGALAPVTGPQGLGRRRWALIFQPGDLPAVGTGALCPRSRGIGCTQKA